MSVLKYIKITDTLTQTKRCWLEEIQDKKTIKKCNQDYYANDNTKIKTINIKLKSKNI